MTNKYVSLNGDECLSSYDTDVKPHGLFYISCIVESKITELTRLQKLPTGYTTIQQWHVSKCILLLPTSSGSVRKIAPIGER